MVPSTSTHIVSELKPSALVIVRQAARRDGLDSGPMASWTKQEPCSSCGANHGKKLQCEGCLNVGCVMCIGSTGRGICRLCKKMTSRRPV